MSVIDEAQSGSWDCRLSYPEKDGKQLYFIETDGSGLGCSVRRLGPYSEWIAAGIEDGTHTLDRNCYWAATPEDALEQYGKTLPFGLVRLEPVDYAEAWHVKYRKDTPLLNFDIDGIYNMRNCFKGDSRQYIAIIQHIQDYWDAPDGDGVIARMLRESQ